MTTATDAPIPLRITDHALLRWLERVHGVAVDEFRERLRAELDESPRRFGEASPHDEGTYLFVVDGATLVTVLAPAPRLLRPLGTSVFIPRVTA